MILVVVLSVVVFTAGPAPTLLRTTTSLTARGRADPARGRGNREARRGRPRDRPRSSRARVGRLDAPRLATTLENRVAAIRDLAETGQPGRAVAATNLIELVTARMEPTSRSGQRSRSWPRPTSSCSDSRSSRPSPTESTSPPPPPEEHEGKGKDKGEGHGQTRTARTGTATTEAQTRPDAALRELCRHDVALDLGGPPDPIDAKLPIEAFDVLAHVAAPPKIWTARSATRPAASEAYSFTIEHCACWTLTSIPASIPRRARTSSAATPRAPPPSPPACARSPGTR